MGYTLEFNCLLVLPGDFDYNQIADGATIKVSKDKGRVYPVNIPIEFCDSSYKYLGKAQVKKLEIDGDTTNLEVKVLKVFSEEESKIFSENFIKPE